MSESLDMSFMFMVFHWPEPGQGDALAQSMREMAHAGDRGARTWTEVSRLPFHVLCTALVQERGWYGDACSVNSSA
jgi:hypothetical protein